MRMCATLSSGSRIEGEAEHVARAVAIDCDMQREEREWVAELRAQGVKAAHPDDGWVDHDADKVHLEYPQFNDGLGVGDLLALGWPFADTRIVCVTGTSENRFALRSDQPWYFHFAPSDPPLS